MPTPATTTRIWPAPVSHRGGAGQRNPPADPLRTEGVLSRLAELSAAIEAIREEMARHGMSLTAPQPDRRQILDADGAGAGLEELSTRQRQVLAGIVRGRANKVIAWELGLSIRTVEAYRAQLIDRLGARNTADAVRLALAAGFRGDEAMPATRGFA